AARSRALRRGVPPGRLRRVCRRGRPVRFPRPRLRGDAAPVLPPRRRRSGRLVQVPVAVAEVDGVAHLVSMLGPGAGWVRNVEAAGGRARLHWRGRERDVLLAPVPVEDRPPVLRRYLAVAPGARPHVGLGPDASLARLRKVADRLPVYRVLDAASAPPMGEDA